MAKFDSVTCDTSAKKTSSNTWLSVTLHSGRNRLVRRLFASQGLEVNKLQRVRYADYILPKTLQPGEFVFVD